MPPKIIQFYEFANFRLDRSRKVLLRDGSSVPLTPKVFDTLEILVENAGLLLEKDELMEKIWHDRFVEESNLASNIKMLRKALGDDAAHPCFIETVPRRGYRFIAEVRETFQESESNKDAAGAFSEPFDRNFADTTALRWVLLPIIAGFIIGAGFVGFWYARSKSIKTFAPVLATPFSAERLSTNGKVLHSIISPDGKNVIYTNGIEGKQSVWLRQLESGNNVEIIPPSDDFYYGLALSPDGNFLYFVRAPKSVARQFDIYRVSIFGGVPQKISGDADGWISISPDGAKISFVRCYYRDDDFCSLWIAAASDGKNEKKLVSRRRPFQIADNAISPDGRSIVFAVGQSDNGANEFGLVEVDIKSGVERELTTQKFFDIRNLGWLPDKSGLLITAARIPNKNFRIWQVSTDSDAVEPLTNDSESYSTLSLDKEANHLVSTQSKEDFRLYLYNAKDFSVAPEILADATKANFAPDGKIVFNSLMTGNDEIWVTNADGSGRRQLTSNPADEGGPVVSPDGSSIFFSSNRTGEFQVWVMNSDGSNQMQITQTEGGFPLSVSSNGKWLYYHHGLSRTLWRVPTNGGKEQPVLNKRKTRFAVSPDGLQAAFSENQGAENVLLIVSLSDGQMLKSFKIADSKAILTEIKWSPDGEYLAYILEDSRYGNKNLWYQPLAGGAARQITELGDEYIAAYSLALAPDGKTVAVVKGGWRHDAVLISGLK